MEYESPVMDVILFGKKNVVRASLVDSTGDDGKDQEDF